MISIQDYKIIGSATGTTSKHPTFRQKSLDLPAIHDGSLTAEDLHLYGKDCGERILPYTMQESYSRANDELCVKSVVMENDFLRATFLPSYGARLVSLYSKTEQRELLFVNSVMRPGNIANRNAWISGGIEWNLGHRGHCAFTCDDMFCYKITAPDGEEFLRFYEYEATLGEVCQLDFHLPSDAKQLGMLMRAYNTRKEDAHLYWWTNTAVPITKHTRIFSATDDILYQIPNGFGRCKMPHQPNMPGVDVSYPGDILRSVEYFFQNDKTCYPWEVSLEEDGKGFFERSTQPLFARKMFCWGNTSGGKHWCDYLSKENEGDYVEIQAGMAPTQNHGNVLPAESDVSFTQMFGSFIPVKNTYHDKDWNFARKGVEEAVDNLLSAEHVETCHKEYLEKSIISSGELIHTGSIYGTLENALAKKQNRNGLPAHLDFTTSRDEESAKAFESLLNGEALPDTNYPGLYLTDALWHKYFEAAKGQSKRTDYHYAISLIENLQEEKGIAILEKLADNNDAFALYALGAYYNREKQTKQALDYFEKSFNAAPSPKDKVYANAFLPALCNDKQYDKVMEIYKTLNAESFGEFARLAVCKAALEANELKIAYELLFYPYAQVREGALAVGDYYFEYVARKNALVKGIPFTPDMIDTTIDLPACLDFRMFLL